MFSHLRDDSRVSRFRGLNSWVLHLAEADLEGRDRVDIIRRRLNPIAEPQPVGLQCPGDDFRGTPVEPVSAAGLMVSGLAAGLGAEVPVQDVVLRGRVVTLAAVLDAKKLGIRVDAEPAANAVVLLDEEGTITPDFPTRPAVPYSSTSGCEIVPPSCGASGLAACRIFRSSRSRSSETASCRRPSTIAIFARSASGSHRSARAARGRWSCG